MMHYPRALDLERLPAVFRQVPADFRVEEILGFEPTGTGEHLWLQVEKTGINTSDVVRALAARTGIREHAIGYAGLKDKQAVAVQWFSLGGVSTIDNEFGNGSGICILCQVRNSRKLRRGSHRGNRFSITLRDVPVTETTLAAWCSVITERGVPNYFGPQRFGINNGNLEKANAMFAGRGRASRHQRGLYLSAARSFLFNQVLAARVTTGNWDKQMPGDIMALQGSASVFRAEPCDCELAGRLARGDIHPTGPLWGQGDPGTTDATGSLEMDIAAAHPEIARGLEQAGLKQERRPLRVMPESLAVKTDGQAQLVVEFSLPGGAYATSVLREMVEAPGL